MTRTVWKSAGRTLEPIFVQRLATYSEAVFPSFKDCVFPSGIQFEQTRIVTLDWDSNTFKHNINRKTFPYVEKIEVVGSTQFINRYSEHDISIVRHDGKTVYEKNGQIRWMYNEWVNKEWLLSQFNELFAKFQEMQQNELRKALK